VLDSNSLEHEYAVFFPRFQSRLSPYNKVRAGGGCKGPERRAGNIVAEPTGLEPATSRVTGERSNQLNYGSTIL